MYKLGLSEFVQNIADLLYDSNSSQPRKGVVAGYMDDLCWAAPFGRMVDVIEFVKSRGPSYGYNLNMKKSTYLMAPGASRLSRLFPQFFFHTGQIHAEFKALVREQIRYKLNDVEGEPKSSKIRAVMK